MSEPRGEVRPDNDLAAAGAGDLRLCRPLSGAPGRSGPRLTSPGCRNILIDEGRMGFHTDSECSLPPERKRNFLSFRGQFSGLAPGLFRPSSVVARLRDPGASGSGDIFDCGRRGPYGCRIDGQPTGCPGGPTESRGLHPL